MTNPNTMQEIQKRLTLEQRQQVRRAEESAKRMAAQRAEQREIARRAAERESQPRNVFREILAQDGGRYATATLEGRRRREQLERQAIARDAEIQEKLIEQEKRDRILNDEGVQISIKLAEGYCKLCEPEDAAECAEMLVLAKEGEVGLFREKQSEYLNRLFVARQEKLQAAATAKSAATENYEIVRRSYQQTKSMLDHSDEINVTGPLDRQDNAD